MLCVIKGYGWMQCRSVFFILFCWSHRQAISDAYGSESVQYLELMLNLSSMFFHPCISQRLWREKKIPESGECKKQWSKCAKHKVNNDTSITVFTTNKIMCCRKQHRAYVTPYLDLVDPSHFAVKLKTIIEKIILDFLGWNWERGRENKTNKRRRKI